MNVRWVGLVCLVSVACNAQMKKAAQPWVASWATSMQAPEPENGQPPLSAEKLTDTTVREVVHLSAGGPMIRVGFSNAFGKQPLTIDSAHVALAISPTSNGVKPGTDHELTFDGRTSVILPVGAEIFSDPLPLTVAALSDLAISFHLPKAPSVETCHPGSHANSWFVHGMHPGDEELTDATKTIRWLQIAEVDVAGDAREAVVTFGDSITDGHGSTTDGNDRWPDVLATRLQGSAKTKQITVANEGIGGNHLLTNGLGENVLQRFDRDVLGVSGVKTLVVLEGINDVGYIARETSPTDEEHVELVKRMEMVYRQIVERAHAHGIRVIGATMVPFVGSDYYHPTPANEADRAAVNDWIRTSRVFDAVVDLDAITRDPQAPTKLLPAYDSGDHLHPGPAGYKAMGDAVFAAIAK